MLKAPPADLPGNAPAPDEVEEWPGPLPPMAPRERMEADLRGLQLTLGRHPMAFLRPRLKEVWRAADLVRARHGQTVRIAGNVICRQRPGTAKGFVFISLEDETGICNAVVAPKIFEQQRLLITQESFLLIEGRLQKSEGVTLVQAKKFERIDPGLAPAFQSHDFR